MHPIAKFLVKWGGGMSDFLTKLFNNKGTIKYGVFDVVFYVLNKLYELSVNSPEYLPTDMKLQKLLYFIQGFHMKYNDGALLFNENFQAWVNGPVVPVVFQQYKYYGTSVISKSEIGSYQSFSKNDTELINSVVEEYGKISPYQLSELTHRPDTAWKKTRRYYNIADFASCQCVIPNNYIAEEFNHKELKGYTVNAK